MSRTPLFQVMLVYQKTSGAHQTRLGEVELLKEDYEHTTAKFDLIFGDCHSVRSPPLLQFSE